jgi:hypothetical protein
MPRTLANSPNRQWRYPRHIPVDGPGEGTEVSQRDRSSPEEFYSRCMSNALLLEGTAHRYAVREDAVRAVSAAWGADVFSTQAVIWERILVASRAPQRRFFEVAAQLIAGLSLVPALLAETATAYDVVRAARNGLLRACEPDLRRSLEAAWSDIEYLDVLPAPTQEAVDRSAVERLEGMSSARYVVLKRGEAQETMGAAQAKRIRGETGAAVDQAYASDVLALEAYLVESAVAAGDNALVTVTIRWELATHSVARLSGLPDDFVAAVTCIRDALWSGLGDADGDRLIASLIAV